MKEIEKMTAEELISRYGIIIPEGNEKKIRTTDPELVEREGAAAAIKAHAKEIYNILKARKAAEEKADEEHKAKVNAIPGFRKVMAAYFDMWKYNDEWEDSFEDVGGLGVRPKPKYNFKEMREEYPQAFAYIRAMKMEEKHNLESVAREAMEQILNGNWEQAVENMNKAEEAEKKREAEWLNKHMWD